MVGPGMTRSTAEAAAKAAQFSNGMANSFKIEKNKSPVARHL